MNLEVVTRSGRRVRTPQRLIQVMAAEIAELTHNNVEGELLAYQLLCPKGREILTGKKCGKDCRCNPLLAYKATADPDTMYFHQAMKEPDRAKFIKAMIKEVSNQSGNGNFTVELHSTVPEGATVLRAV